MPSLSSWNLDVAIELKNCAKSRYQNCLAFSNFPWSFNLVQLLRPRICTRFRQSYVFFVNFCILLGSSYNKFNCRLFADKNHFAKRKTFDYFKITLHKKCPNSFNLYWCSYLELMSYSCYAIFMLPGETNSSLDILLKPNIRKTIVWRRQRHIKVFCTCAILV